MNICAIVFPITYQYYFIFFFSFVYNLRYLYEDTVIHLFLLWFVFFCTCIFEVLRVIKSSSTAIRWQMAVRLCYTRHSRDTLHNERS